MDWLSQLGAHAPPPEEQERQIENLLLHGQTSEKTRNLILQQLATAPPQPGNGKPMPAAVAANKPAAAQQAAVIAGLLFGSPDFQRR